MSLIPRHRIFHIAPSHDANDVCTSLSEGIIKWKGTTYSEDITVASLSATAKVLRNTW